MEDDKNPFSSADPSETFQQSRDAFEQTGKHNILYSVLKAAITNDPMHILNAIEGNQQAAMRAEQAKQYMNTDDFKELGKLPETRQFQNMAANFAGSGDITHAGQMVTAGRLWLKRKKEQDDAAALEKAVTTFKEDNGAAYEEALKRQNPLAYATLQSRKRSEERQAAGDIKQQAKDALAEIKGNPETAPIKQATSLISKVQSKNLSPADYDLPLKDLTAKLGDKKAAEQFIQMRDQMAAQGKGLEESGIIGKTLRPIGRSLGLDINPPTEAVPKEEFFKQIIPQTMNKDQVQQYQNEQAQIQQLNQQIKQADVTKAGARVYTKPKASKQPAATDLSSLSTEDLQNELLKAKAKKKK